MDKMHNIIKYDDNGGNEVKIGRWKVLDEKFGFKQEITCIGKCEKSR